MIWNKSGKVANLIRIIISDDTGHRYAFDELLNLICK